MQFIYRIFYWQNYLVNSIIECWRHWGFSRTLSEITYAVFTPWNVICRLHLRLLEILLLDRVKASRNEVFLCLLLLFKFSELNLHFNNMWLYIFLKRFLHFLLLFNDVMLLILQIFQFHQDAFDFHLSIMILLHNKFLIHRKIPYPFYLTCQRPCSHLRLFCTLVYLRMSDNISLIQQLNLASMVLKFSIKLLSKFGNLLFEHLYFLIELWNNNFGFVLRLQNFHGLVSFNFKITL